MTANTSSYALSSLAPSVVRIKQMTVTPVGGTNSQPIRLTTLNQILSWQQAGGGSAVANGPVKYYSLSGIDRIDFYPTPSTADVLTIYYVAQPTALSGNTDVPILTEPFASKVLEYGALAEAADFKGDPALQDYRNQFEVWKQRYRSHLTRKMGGQPGQFNMFPGGIYPAHDPSTDTGLSY